MMCKKIEIISLAIFAWFSLCSFSVPTDEDMLSLGLTTEELELLKQDSIEGQTGLIHFDESHFTLNVPQGFVYLDKEQATKLLVDYWDNQESHCSDIEGAIVPEECECFYQVSVAYVISYIECGYVRDRDANQIDYDKLLKELKAENDQSNEGLLSEQQLKLIDWAVSPRYAEASHTLVWAFLYSRDDYQTVNYDMRILGKLGYISINAVFSPEDLLEVQRKEELMINSIAYRYGYRYSDFDEKTDPISDWTIGALVAGSVLAKSGFLAKIGVAILKFWKLIALGAAAIFGGILKFSKKRK